MNAEKALLDAAGEGRAPHALIVSGEGAEALCEKAAMAFLCEGGAEKPCNVCPSCRMFLAASHPDVFRLLPEPGKKTVGVESVRALILALSAAPVRSRGKAVLIFSAEKLTEKAQNALLKTLEDPPDSTVFFLAGIENALLPTVRSRCMAVRLPESAPAGDEKADRKAAALISCLLSKKPLDRSAFPMEREELDDFLERMANACAQRFAEKPRPGLSAAVDTLTEARRRLGMNANVKLLIDWTRVKLERIFG